MKILATFFLLLFLNQDIAFSAENKLVQNVIEIAKIRKTSTDRQWIKLLHIERNFLGIKGSQLINNDFFFTENHSDSEAELEKTLLAFTFPAEDFAKEILDNRNNKIIDHSNHAICRFPARLNYLKNALKDADQFWNSLPNVNCTFQKIYLNAIDLKSISFVFSSYYSDSPGSAFGHTFFRLNRKSNLDNQELLDFGVGFAAEVSVTNPIAYALLGLVGGFRGIWTNLPYYYKVREYNDFESRDLWSYDLNLTEDEIKMFAWHLWEIGSGTYRYYFFTQNCAFHMLTALEAAAPRLHLIEHIPFYYVIPSDSMKTLFHEKELVKNITYRPSLQKIFNTRLKRLDKISLDQVKNFSRNFIFNPKQESRSDSEYAEYLDALIDVINLKFANLDEQKNATLFNLKEEILQRRANVNHISKPIKLEANLEDRPDLSHGSSRFNLNYQNHQNGFGVGYRFAIHDLLDNTTGLPTNSQLEFFNLSFLKENKKIELQNFNLFKVFNLNPLNFYERKVSWGLKLGSRRLNLHPNSLPEFYSSGMETAVGYSIKINEDKSPSIIWTMARADMGLAPNLNNNKLGYQALGYQFGLLQRFNQSNAFLLTYEKMFPNHFISYDFTEFEFRTSITKDLSLGVGINRKQYHFNGYWYF